MTTDKDDLLQEAAKTVAKRSFALPDAAKDTGVDALSVGASVLPGVMWSRVARVLGAPAPVGAAIIPAVALGRGLWHTHKAREQGRAGFRSNLGPQDAKNLLLSTALTTGAVGGLSAALGGRPSARQLGTVAGLNALLFGVDRVAGHLAQNRAFDQRYSKASSPRPAVKESPEAQRIHDKRVAMRAALRDWNASLLHEGETIYLVPPQGRREKLVSSPDNANIWLLAREALATRRKTSGPRVTPGGVLAAGVLGGAGALYFNPLDDEDLLSGKYEWGFEKEPDWNRAAKGAGVGAGLALGGAALGALSDWHHNRKPYFDGNPLRPSTWMGVTKDVANSLVAEPLINVPRNALRVATWPLGVAGMLATQGPANLTDIWNPLTYKTRARHVLKRNPHLPLQAALSGLGIWGAWKGMNHLRETGKVQELQQEALRHSKRLEAETAKLRAEIAGLLPPTLSPKTSSTPTRQDQLGKMVQAAMLDPELEGVTLSVHNVVPIYSAQGVLVGLHSPRKTPNGYRLGAVYIAPEHRGKGYATKAAQHYFKGKKAAPVPVRDGNAASERLFAKLGFEQTDDTVTDGDWTGKWWVPPRLVPSTKGKHSSLATALLRTGAGARGAASEIWKAGIGPYKNLLQYPGLRTAGEAALHTALFPLATIAPVPGAVPGYVAARALLARKMPGLFFTPSISQRIGRGLKSSSPRPVVKQSAPPGTGGALRNLWEHNLGRLGLWKDRMLAPVEHGSQWLQRQIAQPLNQWASLPRRGLATGRTLLAGTVTDALLPYNVGGWGWLQGRAPFVASKGWEDVLEGLTPGPMLSAQLLSHGVGAAGAQAAKFIAHTGVDTAAARSLAATTGAGHHLVNAALTPWQRWWSGRGGAAGQMSDALARATGGGAPFDQARRQFLRTEIGRTDALQSSPGVLDRLAGRHMERNVTGDRWWSYYQPQASQDLLRYYAGDGEKFLQRFRAKTNPFNREANYHVANRAQAFANQHGIPLPSGQNFAPGPGGQAWRSMRSGADPQVRATAAQDFRNQYRQQAQQYWQGQGQGTMQQLQRRLGDYTSPTWGQATAPTTAQAITPPPASLKSASVHRRDFPQVLAPEPKQVQSEGPPSAFSKRPQGSGMAKTPGSTPGSIAAPKSKGGLSGQGGPASNKTTGTPLSRRGLAGVVRDSKDILSPQTPAVQGPRPAPPPPPQTAFEARRGTAPAAGAAPAPSLPRTTPRLDTVGQKKRSFDLYGALQTLPFLGAIAGMRHAAMRRPGSRPHFPTLVQGAVTGAGIGWLPQMTVDAHTGLTKMVRSSAPSGAGLFLRLPRELGQRLFAGREGVDDSPPHTTFLYLGELSGTARAQALTIIAQECARTPVPTLSLGRLACFPAGANGVPWYMQVDAPAHLHALRRRIIDRLYAAGVSVQDRFQDQWRPHVTLGYLPKGEPWQGVQVSTSFDPPALEMWEGGKVSVFAFASPTEDMLGEAAQKISSRSLLAGAQAAVTWPLRASPVATLGIGTGAAGWGLNEYLGSPIRSMAKSWRYAKPPQYQSLYSVYGRGSGHMGSFTPYG